MTTYTVYSPDDLNFPLGVIDKNGNVLSGVGAVDAIIANARKGTVGDKANNLLCVPDTDHPKEKDLITLGKLLGSPSKLKDRDFVSNLLKRFSSKKKESSGDIRIVKSGNRHMSKLDWAGDRVKNQVQGLIAQGKSLSIIVGILLLRFIYNYTYALLLEICVTFFRGLIIKSR